MVSGVANKPPALLIVSNFIAGSGGRAASEDLALHLRARGWSVLTTSTKRSKVPRLLDMLRTTWRVRRRCDVALVDLYSGPASTWAVAVCVLWTLSTRKPYIVTLHGGNLPTFSARWPKLVRRLLHGAAAVTAPSQYLTEQMSPYRRDLLLIPNGVSVDSLGMNRRSLSPDLVWVRAFHTIYNPVLAVRVLAELKRDYPDATLTMVGPDKGDGSLDVAIAEADRLAVRDSVAIVGPVPRSEVPLWLGRGAIFLNTTNVDNTPVSVIEAMAGGMCVVSTNVGGLPYLLQDGVDALLTPPDDSPAMTAAVRRLLADPELATRLAVAARQKAERFDWSAVIPKWQALLSQTMVVKPRSQSCS